MRGALTALCGAALALMAACTDDVSDEYARHSAFLRVTPVTAAAPLREALTGPGMFCTVTLTPAAYRFTRPDGTAASIPRTALDNYGTPKCIAGFIVGTPVLPGLDGSLAPVAYDLACPNCYEADYITRSLALADDGTAACSRCGRVYSLQTAVVQQGDKGRGLYKYRLVYAPTQDLLTIWN